MGGGWKVVQSLLAVGVGGARIASSWGWADGSGAVGSRVEGGGVRDEEGEGEGVRELDRKGRFIWRREKRSEREREWEI